MRGLAIAALVLWLGGCCSDVPCTSGLFWETLLPGIDASNVDGLTIRACRNAVCSTGTLAPRPAQRSSVATLTAETTSSDAPTGDARAFPAGEGFFALRVDVMAQGTPVADGDTYRIDVTDPSGALVASLPEESVTYLEERPNGPDCPGSCLIVTRGGI